MADSKSYQENPARLMEDYVARLVTAWVGQNGQVTNTGAGTGEGPDFRIGYVDGRTAIGEVGWHQDCKIQQMWAETFKRDAQQVVLPPGTGKWTISLTRGASIKDLYQGLPPLIEEILESGKTDLDIVGSWPPGPIADRARQLGIEYAGRVEDSEFSRAIFWMPGTGGYIPSDPNVIVDWVGEVVTDKNYEDMTRKLLDREADERHIFIISGSQTSFGVDERLRRLDDGLPNRAPTVPTGISHVWVAARFTYREGSVGLWTADGGWTAVPPPSC